MCCENSTIMAAGGFWETLQFICQCDMAITVALAPALAMHSQASFTTLENQACVGHLRQRTDEQCDGSIIPANP